jgi:hypothetical protein
MEVSGQLHAPATLFPGKEGAKPLHRGLGGTPEPAKTFWRRETRHSPAEIRTPVDSRYTDCAIRCAFNAVCHV